MAAPDFKPLLLARSRQRACGLLSCPSPFRGNSLGRRSHPVLFQCSSTADAVTEMTKSHNRGIGSFIAAGVSEHTMTTNAYAGQKSTG